MRDRTVIGAGQRQYPATGQPLPTAWPPQRATGSTKNARKKAPRRRSRGRRGVLLAVVVVLLAGAVTTGLVVASRPGWRLAWHDEFDGTDLSAANWTARNDTWAGNEESIVTSRPDNVRVGDGELALTARREVRTADGTTRNFTSGYLDTIGNHSFRYGRFEIRARLPQSEGLWPAFWLRADRGLGEIDVLEGVGGVPTSVTQTVHQSTNGGRGKFGQVARLNSGTTTAHWHTYGVEVERERIRWSVDGRTTFQVTSRQAPWIAATFDRPLNIRLNLQVGGSFPAYYGHPVGASTVFPATFQVDWVRVYQFG